VLATKIDEGESVNIILTVTDAAGQSSTCTYNQQAATDAEPPSCSSAVSDPGPPSQVQILIEDDQSGLKSIQVLENFNADVEIPAFTVGTNLPVDVLVTQITSSLEFSVMLEVTDVKDNTVTCRYPAFNPNASRPEYDAVGKDSSNFFNGFLQDRITANALDVDNRKINDFSDFAEESFSNNAGNLSEDPCFSNSSLSLLSAPVPSWTEAEFTYEIVLQMKPNSDILASFHACVLESGYLDVMNNARQTGLYRLPWNPQQTMFVVNSNPKISIKALPGPFALEEFPENGFYLDARMLP
jgi:hypothetical protein